MTNGQQLGLILGGGGARAAYQVGVLKAIAEIIPEDVNNPFPILCGTSAGSINAAVLAASALSFKEGVGRLVGVWENFAVEKVYRADIWSACWRGGRLIFYAMTGGLGQTGPRSLLDNTPLRQLLERHLSFERIDQAVDSGDLRALAVTACSYTTGKSVSFYRGSPDLVPWERARRLGRRGRIHLDHLLASSAIPVVFPAIAIDGEYFGDGSMRQTAPISPALHLGADKVLVIGVRQKQAANVQAPALTQDYPSIGQTAGYILDTLFLNSLDADIERLQQTNRTLQHIPANRRAQTGLKTVQTLVISPSQDIAAIAAPYIDLLPASVEYLMRIIGARRAGGQRLLSYLLFESEFCRELIKLGFNDALEARKQVLEFLEPSWERA